MLENKIAEMLGQLADKLGVASAKIWEIPELLINPEYAAFQNIVEQLGSLK